VKRGEVGEIYLRGPLLSDFTYNNDDAKRREIALGDLVTVGDVGYQDQDGYLFLCDRKRDMIISGGVNIYPAEIESVLIEMPGVRDCAVFGIPDKEFGEQICAHVEPLAGASIDAMAVRSYLGQHLARYKLPKVVELRASLPREDGQDLQTQATRSVLGKGGAQHLRGHTSGHAHPERFLSLREAVCR
jgi:long-chain acyl-CoA synthetase